jgi:hypothetical protein
MDVFQNINGKINEEVVISFIANRLNLKVGDAFNTFMKERKDIGVMKIKDTDNFVTVGEVNG